MTTDLAVYRKAHMEAEIKTLDGVLETVPSTAGPVT